MKILLFFSSGLGDALFLAPTYFALRELYPSAHITAMVPKLGFNKYLLEEIFRFDDVIPLQRPHSLSPFAVISYFKYFCKLTKNIRKQKFDMAIPTVEARLPDQYILTYASRAKSRIGPKYWYCRNNIFRFILTNQVVSPFNGNIIDLHFNLVRSIEKRLDIQRYIDKTTNALVESSKPSNFVPVTNKILVISPGSGAQPYKRWPFKNFVEVISNVFENYKCDIVILSGKQEYDANLIPAEIANNPRFHNLSDILTVPQIIHLFLKADLIIGNDNGLLHLAEFLNKPTIGIYPGNWALYSKRFFNNDTKHIVLPKKDKDILAEQLMDTIWRTMKIQNIYKQTVNSVQSDDVITEINKTSLLR